jgi:hypothetical protein
MKDQGKTDSKLAEDSGNSPMELVRNGKRYRIRGDGTLEPMTGKKAQAALKKGKRKPKAKPAA